jgi:Zinc finger, C3HC4 type (RING finger)
VKNLRREKDEVKKHNKRLVEELDGARDQLQQMNHLICDICYDNVKSVVTRCGQGFCQDCLSTLFRHGEDDREWWDSLVLIDGANCPSCRHPLKQKADVWPIYVAADQNAQEVDVDGEAA